MASQVDRNLGYVRAFALVARLARYPHARRMMKCAKRREAGLQVHLIFVFVIVASCAALFSVIFLFSSDESRRGARVRTLHVALSC